MNCAGYEAFIVTDYLVKPIMMGTKEFLNLIIAQNYYHTRLWRVLRSELEGKKELLTIWVDDRSF